MDERSCRAEEVWSSAFCKMDNLDDFADLEGTGSEMPRNGVGRLIYGGKVDK